MKNTKGTVTLDLATYNEMVEKVLSYERIFENGFKVQDRYDNIAENVVLSAQAEEEMLNIIKSNVKKSFPDFEPAGYISGLGYLAQREKEPIEDEE